MKPLGITKSAFLNLVDQYNIGQEIMDLIVSFENKPHSSDAGHGDVTLKKREDGSYGKFHSVREYVANGLDMQYLFTFPEDYRTSNGVLSWTTRQVAVFNRYCPSYSGNLWIFLHAKPNSKAQNCVEAEISQYRKGCPRGDWVSLHMCILSAHLVNWRWHIRYLGEEVETLVGCRVVGLATHIASGAAGWHCADA